VPAIPVVVLVFPIVAQFYPAPPAPLNIAAPLCAAWLVIGIVVVLALSTRAPEALAQSSSVFVDE
jgi:uncharacterized membrane protein YhhN